MCQLVGGEGDVDILVLVPNSIWSVNCKFFGTFFYVPSFNGLYRNTNIQTVICGSIFKLEFFQLVYNVFVKISFVDFSFKISSKKPMK